MSVVQLAPSEIPQGHLQRPRALIEQMTEQQRQDPNAEGE